ncbi:MAG TPA: XrtA system polysaccharide chain length determinant [Casimicrobiaceae bacterium]|nr:XrtA system polysaccharide chain length determinant [Casimicrobiaceae bacterium]
MQEIIQQALVYLRGMWHRRWIGLACAWIVAVVGIAVVSKIPEKFEASARVYVDTETLLRPLLAGLAIQPNVDQQVALISRTLISRPNVEKLIRLADLDLRANSPQEREELVDTVMASIKLGGNVGANLYTISYRDADPQRARKVVQSLLNIFVESSLGNKLQDTQSAVKFLDDQIKRYEETLQATEDKIKDFRIKYMSINRDGQDYFARMSALSAAIEQAKLELESAEQSRDSYKRQLAGETPIYVPEANDASADNGGVTLEIDSRISALKRDLDTLLRKYTEEHPDVIATRRLISQLEAQRKTELDARRKAMAAEAPHAQNPMDQNPVFQQLRISLADSEAAVASSRAKLAGLQSQFQQLKAQAQLVPQIEAEYTQLNRDYDVQKRTYQSLVSRRESATMGKDVQDTGAVQFKIIDPPRVSPQPVAPNRLALLGLVAALSLGAGLFASLIASQMMPTFHDARTLRDITKRPILGMVSMLPSEALRRARRRGAWLFAGGLGGLVAGISAAFAFVLMVSPNTI